MHSLSCTTYYCLLYTTSVCTRLLCRCNQHCKLSQLRVAFDRNGHGNNESRRERESERESEPHVSVPHGRRLHDDAVSFSSSSPLSFLLCRLLPTTAASVLQQQPSLSLSFVSCLPATLCNSVFAPSLSIHWHSLPIQWPLSLRPVALSRLMSEPFYALHRLEHHRAREHCVHTQTTAETGS